MAFYRKNRDPEELRALFDIVVRTAGTLGENYFDALVRSMAAALRVRYAFVSVFADSDTRMRIVALWDGERFRNVGEYDISLSPCREVMKGTEFFCPRDVRKSFPKDPQMKGLGAQSYRGVPMIGATGRHFGHIAAVDTKPIKAEPRFTSIMQICATRVAAEMERLESERAIFESEGRLRAVVHSTRDAIITIDGGRIVKLANRSAERMLGCTAADIVGSSLDPFFSKKLTAEVVRCTTCLDEDEAKIGVEPTCLWLRDGVSALRADGISFPIEASIAPVSLEGRPHYTLVLRDMDERQRAQAEIERLGLEANYLSEELRRAHGIDGWIGESAAMRKVLKRAERVTGTDATVLITGESGTGKELVARMLHAGSERGRRALVKVDCAALPENLIESELFGHEKGAFTGATARRRGRFEMAHGGTVFLDEIGELPLLMQAKLLRVLEEREFERVGGSETLRVDVRIIAATNRDLGQMVVGQRFREDLYFRLNVVPIEMPPLRDRPEDVRPLAELFLARFAKRIGRTIQGFSDESEAAILAYSWPGNIRELKNVIERSVILSTTPVLDVELPLAEPGSVVAERQPGTLREVERRHILATLGQTGGVVEGPGGAARILDINPSTLRNRMRKLGIRPEPTAEDTLGDV